MKEYFIKVTEDEVQVIGTALGKEPFNLVAKLVINLQNQINKQNEIQSSKAKKNESATDK